MSFRLAKLPEETESEGASEELESIFLFTAPELDPDKDLNCSRLFMPDNPRSLLIAKITNEICSKGAGFDLKPSDYRVLQFSNRNFNEKNYVEL